MLTQLAECVVDPQPNVASNNPTFESEHPPSLSVILGYCGTLTSPTEVKNKIGGGQKGLISYTYAMMSCNPSLLPPNCHFLESYGPFSIENSDMRGLL